MRCELAWSRAIICGLALLVINFIWSLEELCWKPLLKILRIRSDAVVRIYLVLMQIVNIVCRITNSFTAAKEE